VGQVPLEKVFGPLHTSYAAYYRLRYGGLGAVFADRPANHDVNPATIAYLLAYIHMNPVRAGIVRRPEDSTWTSHRAYLRIDEAPSWSCFKLQG